MLWDKHSLPHLKEHNPCYHSIKLCCSPGNERRGAKWAEGLKGRRISTSCNGKEALWTVIDNRSIHMFKYFSVFLGTVYTNFKKIEFNCILALRLLLWVCEMVIPRVWSTYSLSHRIGKNYRFSCSYWGKASKWLIFFLSNNQCDFKFRTSSCLSIGYSETLSLL